MSRSEFAGRNEIQAVILNAVRRQPNEVEGPLPEWRYLRPREILCPKASVPTPSGATITGGTLNLALSTY